MDSDIPLKNSPVESESIRDGYLPPPETLEMLTRKFNELQPLKPGDTRPLNLFRYNLTQAGIERLIHDGIKYLSDVQDRVLIRYSIIEYEGRKFAVVWPGGLAFHLGIQRTLQENLPSAKEVWGDSISANRKRRNEANPFEHRRIVDVARIIAAEVTRV